ncbi:T9SS type A sorting domain-containing protein [Spirosoma litoris]
MSKHYLPTMNAYRPITSRQLRPLVLLLGLLLALFHQQALAQGTTWTSQTSVNNNQWSSVTYGNGLFVAVSFTGSGNQVMTSPDGITWTSQTAASNSNWSEVAYGNGLFVAVGYNGSVMTSPDGITWTSQTSGNTNHWNSLTYGNGLFVAVASEGSVMTSPDGITWTSRTSAASNVWTSVTYGNGLFVATAITGSGNRVMTSPDGITWTSRTSASDNQWYGVTYGNGLFVAVAGSGTGNRVMTSTDGITWTSRSSATDNSWQSVTYGNGLFVAVANTGSGNRVMTSPDGITWTSQAPATNNDWYSVTYANCQFVAVALTGSGNRVMTSNLTTAITAMPSLTITQGQSATLSAAAGATSYSWSNGETTSIISTTAPGTYSVTATTGACSATASATVTPINNPMSVNLLYFNGRNTPLGNLLEWKTAQEIDNAGFTILRGDNPTSLEAIGEVASQATDGNAHQPLTYSFLDTAPLPGLSYYRFVQTDFDGTKTLSALIAIRSNDQTPVLFPNPVPTNGVLRLEPPQAFDRYELIEASGKIIHSVEQSGVLSELSLPSSASGTYWLRLQNGATRQVYRLVK